MRLIRKISTLTLILWAFSVLSIEAQTGVLQDRKKTFLIPMMQGNELVGHAQVDLLDKVSKDSNSYAVQVYDEFLHDVGEKKLMLGATFNFIKAGFNGKEIVTKFFSDKKQEARYICLNQKAEVVFDTTIQMDRYIEYNSSYQNYVSTSMHTIPNQGILDYYVTNKKGKNKGGITWIGMDHHIWQYETEQEGLTNFLYADKNMSINSVYEYKKDKIGNDVNSYVQGISGPGGTLIFNTQLNTNDQQCVYPIAASMDKNKIEIISEFTHRTTRYGRIKWGLCVHRLDLNGHLIDAVYNDLTESMRADSIFKKNKLLLFSYLYMHKAIKLKNGQWLVAAEHIRRNFNAAFYRGKRKDVYNKKSICLLVVNGKAQVEKTFLEPNKEESVMIDNEFLHHPHNGSIDLLQRNRLDISYFMQDESKKNDCISFVFTDINGRAKKISLGQMKYEDGEVKVDKFNIPLLTSATRISVLPSRFGHVLLFKYDPFYGVTDFDNIKFNK